MLINNIKPPCYNCSDRAIGCHGNCQAYSSYRAKADEVKAKRAELRRKDDLVNGCLNGVTKMRLYGGW